MKHMIAKLVATHTWADSAIADQWHWHHMAHGYLLTRPENKARRHNNKYKYASDPGGRVHAMQWCWRLLYLDVSLDKGQNYELLVICASVVLNKGLRWMTCRKMEWNNLDMVIAFPVPAEMVTQRFAAMVIQMVAHFACAGWNGYSTVCWNGFSNAVATLSSCAGLTMQSLEFNGASTMRQNTTIAHDRWLVDCWLMWVQWTSSLWSLPSHSVIYDLRKWHMKHIISGLDRFTNSSANRIHQFPILKEGENCQPPI